MVGSRTRTALVGLAVSLAVSVAAWYYFDTLLVFLFLPFVPVLFRGLTGGEDRQPAKTCPTCGFETRARDVNYCPRDGAQLVVE
ncbi:hypothetical protein [Halobaculum marinum]|uniref:Zinc ribbon domain-containing protein n=1 Tax=Halobaculum marinum TaxID=3031996 RepID=A0ABD5WVI3_9EURY|nr:hypothetical protein [Halobaculum sp. DT55]